jgi:protein-L-isoaspartate(D-aspartate) O-methyltransferase
LIIFLILYKFVFIDQDSFKLAAIDSGVMANSNINSSAKPSKPRHGHIAFTERTRQRHEMVRDQIYKRGVTDPNVLTALRTVPRHAFVRKGDQRQAYRDHPLPIGYSQTISQPYIVGYMTEALELEDNFKVLEVGTGSGYQAAVCAEIAKEVYTIEIVEVLAKSAQQRLKKLGYDNVHVKAGDGYYGWNEHAPFDAIIVTAAAGLVPPPLIKQLKPGGIMILPLGSPYGFQSLVLIIKNKKGEIFSEQLFGVRFVPMTGKIMETK